MRRLIGLLLLAALAAFAGGAEDQNIYQDFLGWYKTVYAGSFMPQEVMKGYRESQQKAGVAAEEIERRLGIIRQRVARMPADFAAVHFDRIYSMNPPPFRTEASHYLVRMVEGRKPGKALDVAMGQGRNALYLASQGWEVTGYDISAEGMARARALAEKAGLRLEIVKAAHEEFDYGTAKWDLIVETFAFTNLADPAYRKRVVDSLKPGGMLVIEGFGGPKNVLLEGFRDLRIVQYEDCQETADWGLQKSRLQRVAATKD
jgi:2-polyprenyl-3-methyl-5-hydroxy-6-metoxy-1,4-benzoquinol methylase